MKTIAFVLLALIGCTKKSDKPDNEPATATTTASTASCATSIPRAYDRLPGDNPQMQGMVAKLKEIMVKLCTDDNWPKPVLECYETAKTQPEMKACRDGLPPEIKAKVGAHLVQVMNEMRGAGGMGSGPDPHSGSAAPPAGSAVPK